MERLSENAINIINSLHTDRLDYHSEYVPLIDAANLLAAYEDAGLEPEGVQAVKNALMGKVIAEIKEFEGVPIDRLRELAQADQEGRLVVLPCKVGDTAWVKGRSGLLYEMRLKAPDIRFVCTDEDNLCMALCNRKPNGFCAYRIKNDGSDIGKEVFLTREEAEA